MDTKAMQIPELISKTLETYKDLGYTRQSVDKIRSVYKELAWYCTQHNELTYSLELMERFQRDVYDEEHGAKERHWAIKRAVNMLHDYRLFGAVLRKSKKERAFKPQFSESGDWYLEMLTRRNLAESSMYNHKLSLIRFTDYLDSQGINSPGEIRIEHISGFIKAVIRNYSNRRMSHEIYVFVLCVATHNTNTYDSAGAVSHVGIYVGDGMMIHCGNPIGYANVNSGYWQDHFYGFGRLN